MRIHIGYRVYRLSCILGCFFFCSEVLFSKGHPYSKYCLYEYILNPKFQDFSMRFGRSKINRSYFTKLLSSRSNQLVLMITSMNFTQFYSYRQYFEKGWPFEKKNRLRLTEISNIFLDY